ncbi:MAG TPA: hypothetical protein PLF62_10810 [Clostridia bacterium]|jgi:hypothetical protein|nr:hypothetical protein [Clostridia bacterium]
MNVRLVPVGGSNQIEIDGKIVDSLAFKTFRPEETNIGDFYQAGVRLFNIISTGMNTAFGTPYSLYGESWLGDGVYDLSVVDKQIDFFAENAPDAKLFLNFQLDTRPWWHDAHPDEADSYFHLSQVAANENWRRTAADYIRALIEHVEKKYPDKIFAYVLLGGYTTEWFSEEDYQATHPTKLKAYQKYLKDESAEIPTQERLLQAKDKLFLDPVKDKDIIVYEQFHNKLIADTLLYFCHEAQKVLKYKKLLGVFFGYLLELEGARLWNAGHLDIDRVYDSPDIDLIATPSSYQFRKHTDAGAYMILAHTIPLRKKLYFASFDHRTYNYRSMEEGHYIWDTGGVLQNLREVTDVMRREMMQRWANSAGHWWFGMFATWLHDEGIMKEVKHLVKISADMFMRHAHSISEIAVFYSCESMYYVNKECGINNFSILNSRDNLSRIGAPVDYFSIRDMKNVDLSQYKLCIFPNAYSLQEDERELIHTKLMAGNHTLLWMTAPDYLSENGFEHERMEELTGMHLEELDDDETVYLCEGTINGLYDHPLHPTFAIVDDAVEIMGRYKNSGKTALAFRKMNGYNSVFSGLANPSYMALRAVAKKAGVHLYSEAGVPVYVNSLITGIYWHEQKNLKIRMREAGNYYDILSGKIYHTNDGNLVLNTVDSGAICLKKCDCQFMALERSNSWAKQ